MKPWHHALRIATENAVLRWRNRQLERRLITVTADCAKKDRVIRRLKQDAIIVTQMARDPRVAVDFLEWDRETDDEAAS